MIKLASPTISKTAIRNVVKVLNSGNLVQGKYVEEFEKLLSEYLNIDHVVVVSSGTAALHLSLLTLNIKEGDEVIIPAFTFPATANVVEIIGAKPIFVDITLDDLCIDTSRIEQVLSQKTKAIIPVHEFGQSAKIDEILSLSKKYGFHVVEDAACALGAEYGSRKVGTFGDFGCFSFHPRKAITTGEGGAIVLNDEQYAKKLRSLRNHGITINNNSLEFILAGLNYRMTDFQAALGVPQMQCIESYIENRIKIAKVYSDAFQGKSWIKVPAKIENRREVFQTYHITIENGKRNELMKYLFERGIQTNYGAQALNAQSFYSEKYRLSPHSFPNAYHAYQNGLALPIGEHINEDLARKISNEIIKFA